MSNRELPFRTIPTHRSFSIAQSLPGGQRTIERLLSVDQTCRLQRRSLYAYLTNALIAEAPRRRRPVAMRTSVLLAGPQAGRGLLAGST
jgi:hypothetical protein